MDTARVDICYRPLRVAWAIHSGDREGFRRAVRLTHTLWGGRFNPIVMADRVDEARRLMDLFRVDLIVAVGTPKLSVCLLNSLTLFRRTFPTRCFFGTQRSRRALTGPT
jgi:hypothetical protein